MEIAKLLILIAVSSPEFVIFMKAYMLSEIQSSLMKSFIVTSLRFSLSSFLIYILAFLLTLQETDEFLH